MALVLALAAALAAAVPAEVVSARPEAVTITLYREGDLTSRELQEDWDAAGRGLVMVTETRTIDLPAGPARIAFQGVADGMLPQTAALTGLSAPVAEQNYDYDLLTPGALASRSLDETVTLARTDPATGRLTEERAVIRSAPQALVLDVGGRIEALDCAGLPERLVFDRVPQGLADRPTLSVRTTAPRAERRTVKLSYLAVGLAWSADYVARVNPDGRTLDLTGWLTLANSSDTTFGQAPTEVVAGNLSREQVKAIEPRRIYRQSACWPTTVEWGTPSPPPAPPPPPAPMAMHYAGALSEIIVTAQRRSEAMQDVPMALAPGGLARQSELGDYKLYTLPERTTVAARQVKQVRFFEKRRAPFARIHEVELDSRPDEEAILDVEILLRLKNTEAEGLGQPLPAGNVVAFAPSAGRLAFVGQETIRDAAVGLPVEVTVGTSPSVSARQTLIDETDISKSRVRRSYRVELANALGEPVRLELRHPSEDGLRLLKESRRHVMKDGRPLWTVDLPPNTAAALTYTVEVDD